MSKTARRILITTVVLLAALGVLAAVFFSPRHAAQIAPAPQSQPAGASTSSPPTPESNSQPTSASAESGQSAAPGTATQPSTTSPASTAPASTAPAAIPGLHAIATGTDIGPRDQPPQPLGSLDPRKAALELKLTRLGAGIDEILFSNIWETAEAKRQADRYFKQLAPGQPIDFSQLNQSQRYVLQTTQPYYWNGSTFNVPVMAAHSIKINGDSVGLLNQDIWTQTAPGEFQTLIVDGDEHPILEITRRFQINADFDISLQQNVRNLSGQALEVQWLQYGPNDLRADISGYIDRRRFVVGYLPDPQRQPDLVLAGDMDAERTTLLKQAQKAKTEPDPVKRDELGSIWPNSTSKTRHYDLSWLASTNRYFGLAVHPANSEVNQGVKSLSNTVLQVGLDVSTNGVPHDEVIFTSLISPAKSLPANAATSFDLGVYAGPLDREVLNQPTYAALSMQEMILYRMTGGCCTFLTFQWLAKILLWFLSFLHDFVVRDWGVAIVALVIVVRSLLHPLTKRAQINMQRFGKTMSAMKPEIEKLQKKYGSDPKRMQVEQMKLMREHGVSPFQALGCLPMFLQTPIWIALWAMLYLAFEIRHESAFYGVFQLIGHWQFLGDLSSPDDFWILPRGGFVIPLINAHITSLNLLPVLLGVVFFIQQKYMSPPPTPNMTPEQMQQQRIMKVLMVLMMPIFLYKAPSGLTLYIFTSTCIGIMESKYVRSHINQLDLERAGGGAAGPPKKPKKPKDTMGRLWAQKLEEARRKRDQGPPRSFKKRK